jgi:hypothetical protein
MSQTWNIATIDKNTTSPAADIDKIVDGFNALRTVFSGTSAPSSTTPYMFWADTTNNVLKQRNSADNAWIVRATLDSTLSPTKTGSYTVVASDLGKTILCDATSSGFTVAFTAAATLGDGFWVRLKKIDATANVVTLDPNSSETIDGSTTFLIKNKNEAVDIYCNATAFYTGIQAFNKKGADIASASTTDIGAAAGDWVDVTGTTTITSLGNAPSIGLERTVRFTGALTLTYNATSLILPGSASITTAANDWAVFRSLDVSGNWICKNYLKASGASVVAPTTTGPFIDSTALVKGSADATKLLRIEADGITTATTRVWTAPDCDIGNWVVQRASTRLNTVVTNTSTVANPITTTNAASLGTLSFTPKSATNILVIEFSAGSAHGTAFRANIVGLFKDSDVTPLSQSQSDVLNGNAVVHHSIRHIMTAGTTSAITFKILFGASNTGTMTLPSSTSESAFLQVTEYAA